jgi:hypothetical protein
VEEAERAVQVGKEVSAGREPTAIVTRVASAKVVPVVQVVQAAKVAQAVMAARAVTAVTVPTLRLATPNVKGLATSRRMRLTAWVDKALPAAYRGTGAIADRGAMEV